MNATKSINRAVTTRTFKPNLALLSNTMSSSTMRAYSTDLSSFYCWLTETAPCFDADGKPEPINIFLIETVFTNRTVTADVLCFWLEAEGFRYKISTIKRKIAALSWMYKKCGIDDLTKEPIVKESLLGLQRLHAKYIAGELSKKDIESLGVQPPDRNSNSLSKTAAPALKLTSLLRVFDYINENEIQIGKNKALRDKCLLSIWWSGAFRRSEVTALQIKFIKQVDEGLEIILPVSKTDQLGAGIKKGITYSEKYSQLCPVRNYQAWLNTLTKANSGSYLFVKIDNQDRVSEEEQHLNVSSIVRILKSYLKNAGINDPHLYSGHSPRRGFATDAYYAGASTRSIQKQGGWKSERMVNTYIEQDGLFKRNATAAVL